MAKCLAAFVLLSTICIALTACPLGWTGFKGECLYFSHDKHTWTDAEASCRNKHSMAYLVTVDSAAKHSYIQMFTDVLHHFRENSFWLGSSDFAIEGSWRWVETGSGFTGYTNWAPGFPDNNRTHNCLLMKYIGNDPMWVDYNCNSKTYYICEKPDQDASASNVIG